MRSAVCFNRCCGQFWPAILSISMVVFACIGSNAAASTDDLKETARIGQRTGRTAEILRPSMLPAATLKTMRVVPQDGTVVAIGGGNSMSTDRLLANLVLQKVDGSELNLQRDMFELPKDKLDALRQKAKVLVFTQASDQDADRKKKNARLMFDAAGIPIENVTVVDAEMKESIPLDSYDLVYFGGGDQNNLHGLFSKRAVQDLHNYLNHGGIVSGTSAGAAILSKTMFAGGKEEQDGTLSPDVVEMREGFGFFQALSIDMHLFQYKRFARSLAALALLDAKAASPGRAADVRTVRTPVDDVVLALGQDSVAVIQALDLSGNRQTKGGPTGAVKVSIAGTTQTWLSQCGPAFCSDLTKLSRSNALAEEWDVRLSVVPPGSWFVIEW